MNKSRTPYPYIPRRWIEHGGALSIKRRKTKRPIDIGKPIHIVLRSEVAKGNRSLFRNSSLVNFIINRSAKHFRIKIYQRAVCSNHIHLLVKGKKRIDLQNFFRVLAGHSAQEILRKYPLEKSKVKKAGNAPRKYIRRFWELILYSRVVALGLDFKTVKNYIIQNTMEALGLISYQKRGRLLNTS